jgi:hypothetical protein
LPGSIQFDQERRKAGMVMAKRPPCCFESAKGFDSAPGWRRTGWAKFTVEFRIRDRSSLEFGTFSVAISQNGQAALFGGL